MGLLLDNGADVNAKDNLSNNPLYHASRTSTLFVVEPLVTHEVNVRAENNDGMTVQDLASKFAKEFDSSEFIKVADFFEKIALKK